MKPEKALELVGRYSRLTKELKSLKQQIGDHMDKCAGVNGDRHSVDERGWPTYIPDMDSKGRDKGMHIWSWYQPEIQGDGYYSEPEAVWLEVGEEQAAECAHCYAAHEAIQRRKQARKSLGAVKAAMTRGGA